MIVQPRPHTSMISSCQYFTAAEDFGPPFFLIPLPRLSRELGSQSQFSSPRQLPCVFSIRSGRPKLRYANSTPCFMNGLFATCRDFFPRRISSWKRPSSLGETGIYAVASCLDSHLCLVCLDAFRIATEYPYIHVSHMQLVHVVSPEAILALVDINLGFVEH